MSAGLDLPAVGRNALRGFRAVLAAPLGWLGWALVGVSAAANWGALQCALLRDVVRGE